MMASSLESQLAEKVREGRVPQAVVFTADREGKLDYSHAVGKMSLEDGAAGVDQDAVFLLASSTKLLTAIAALQVVERGLIGLEDDVAALLPELAEQPVLRGFDGDDKPVLEDRKVPITLTHLLTHTAGTAYDLGDPNLLKLQSQRGRKPGTGPDVASHCAYPLIYQPGERWMYSSALDWAGLLVERLTNSTLEEYMRANIWKPLGINSMTFFPAQKPELQARVPVLSARGPDGKLSAYKGPFINDGSTGCFGGRGAYGSMRDYLKILRSLLANDGKLLSPASLEELFAPRLTAQQVASHKAAALSPMGRMFIGEFDFEKYEHQWAFGGMVFVQGYEDGRRRAGTLSWGGMANTFWAVDREAGLALAFGTQIIQPGDEGAGEAITVVEKGVYAMAGKERASL